MPSIESARLYISTSQGVHDYYFGTLLDFSISFELAADVAGQGFEAVIIQRHKPFTYFR